MLEALPGYSGGRLPGRSIKERDGEEEEEEKDSRERQVRNEIDQEVVVGTKKNLKDSWATCKTKLGVFTN